MGDLSPGRYRRGAYLALREASALLAVLLVVAGVAAAFVWPWLAVPPVGGAMLATYAPLRDGDARLILQTDADGSVKGWQAQNTRLIPGLRVYTDVRKAIADGFLSGLLRPGETEIPENDLERRLASLIVVETRTSELDINGTVLETWQYFARDERGDLFVGIYYPQNDREIVITPPALTLAGGSDVGDGWSSEGKIGSGRYTWNAALVSRGPYDGTAGRFDDCLEVRSTVVIDVGNGPSETHARDWVCAGLGVVESRGLEPSGAVKQASIWLAANGELVPEAILPPPGPTLDDPPTLAEADRWQMSRLGRARPTGETSEATILPAWIPTDPPLLLAAGFGGDLVAFETHTPGAPARWRFHTAGTIYGQPTYHRESGRIYFGSSDKRLYALDARGQFLWSFQTEDNVAARPAIVGDVLVAAGEDGTVYGLDAATGRQRWTFAAEGGVASWPAVLDGTVIVGSDGGTVYGLNPATGAKRWTLSAAAAVEAPIVLDDDGETVYVASRDGTLAAFKPGDCTEACEPAWSVEPGGALRSAPLPLADAVIAVDEEGELISLRKDDGKRRWGIGGQEYTGAPVLADDAIVVATRRGVVERVSRAGERLERWDARRAMSPADGEPAFSYGPVVGGDAVWIADTNAVVRRLGVPPLGEIPSLSLAWVDQSTRPPFAASQFRNTVAEYQEKAIVVDSNRGVFVLDPATGGGSKLLDAPGESMLAQVDPVVVGDTLLLVSGRTMQAVDLRTGQVRWQGIAPGTSIRPPTVRGDTVLWTTSAEGVASLLALDLADGTMRWQAALGTVTQVGGTVATDDTAFTSTPPAAWDLRTGERRWQATLPDVIAGGPALSSDGRTVYVGGLRADEGAGIAVALDAASGAVRWQVDLNDSVINPLDRIWTEDGLVVVPALEGKVIVLDAETGAERWRFTAPIERLGGITVERGRVWMMLQNARLYGFDLETGRPTARLTELELNLNGQGLTQRPTFVGDRLIFPAGLILLGLDLPKEQP